ncbi:hypothetical protein A4S05_21900 [Nostoc sp. KVJ20]|nr:hypothetical protein A4S05_21900 [Nostoc sp. KVJ20]
MGCSKPSINRKNGTSKNDIRVWRKVENTSRLDEKRKPFISGRTASNFAEVFRKTQFGEAYG